MLKEDSLSRYRVFVVVYYFRWVKQSKEIVSFKTLNLIRRNIVVDNVVTVPWVFFRSTEDKLINVVPGKRDRNPLTRLLIEQSLS